MSTRFIGGFVFGLVLYASVAVSARQPYPPQLQQAINQITNGVITFVTLGMNAGSYINWGTGRQAGGYGLRDNAGVIETKNSGGTWDPISPDSATTFTFSGGSVLDGTGTNTLLQRNSTSAQRWNVANTYTSSIAHEMFSVDWQTVSTVALVGTRTAATGIGAHLRIASQASSGANVFAFADYFGAGSTGVPFIRMGLGTNALGAASSASRGSWIVLGEGTHAQTGGSANVAIAITPTYNQTGTASGTDLLINRTQTAVGSGTQRLIDAQVGGVTQFTVTNLGVLNAVGGLQFNGVNAALGVAASYKIARGSTALDGSNPTTVATGLTTVVSCTGTVLRNSALTSGTAFLTHDTASVANVDWYAWVLAGTASTGTETFEWVCVGT